MDSFKGIYDECQTIVTDLKQLLFSHVDDPGITQRQLVEHFDLIRKVGRLAHIF